VLNDLFSIQARGGCSCAGPYGHRLLAFGAARCHALREEVGHGCDGVKPGWARVNYFISPATAGYIAAAVELIAADGYRLLPGYRFDPRTGLWRHRDGPPRPQITLHELAYGHDGKLIYPRRHARAGRKPSPATCARPGRCLSRSPAILMMARRGFPPTSRPCAGSRCRPPACPPSRVMRSVLTPAAAKARRPSRPPVRTKVPGRLHTPAGILRDS
jgi:hypothetical protein